MKRVDDGPDGKGKDKGIPSMPEELSNRGEEHGRNGKRKHGWNGKLGVKISVLGW